MANIKLKQDVIDFLKQGTKFASREEEYFHMPYWFRKTEEEGVFEVVKFEDLPKDMRDIINGNYQDITLVIKEDKDMLNYPHKQLDIFKDSELGEV